MRSARPTPAFIEPLNGGFVNSMIAGAPIQL
jgi:hypothetical protein